MNILDILNNNWFVSIVSIFLGFLIVPFLNKITGLFGQFSGNYLAITSQPDKDRFLLELVNCKHVGNKIYGKIDGVCFAHHENDTLALSKNNIGKYKFEGFVDERLFVLSYSTTIKTAKSAGTVTLQGNESGTVFRGFWVGFAHNDVQYSKCNWFLVKGKLHPVKDKDIILRLAFQAVTENDMLSDLGTKRVYLIGQHMSEELARSPIPKHSEVIGRSGKVAPREELLDSEQKAHLAFLDAEGGIGKTRLLEKLTRNSDLDTGSSKTPKTVKKRNKGSRRQP